ncbi:MAG: Rpn family recombination-promoting nuclease/putative transposase [Alphaproteobacteria bacterium]|nr:Rpn family recombination-promoting nuclease/putative transposase [Alphaproteobacteria bacterium]
MKSKKNPNFAQKKSMSPFISPFTDFGFKKLFGEDASKPMLISFLNSILPKNNQIKSLEFKNVEQIGDIKYEPKAVFDIFCLGTRNERFIIELQRAPQDYYKDRTLFYSALVIKNQGVVVDWDFNLDPVYCIAILNFNFKDHEASQAKHEVKHVICLKNQFNERFYEKYFLIYLEMPNFTLSLDELRTTEDKWLYFIKNLDKLEDIPSIFKDDDLFTEAFRKANYSNLTPKERDEYEESVKVYRDLKNVINKAFSDGEKMGIQKGKLEGKQIGIQKTQTEGIIKALKRGKLTMNEIAEDFEVPFDLVLNIKDLLKKENGKIGK